MILVDAWKRHKKRKQRICELEKSIHAELMVDHDPDSAIDMEIFHQITKDDQNELDGLLQSPFLKTARRWGVDIPSQYWNNDSTERFLTLSEEGKNWIRREASKKRREWAKEWISILVPVVTTVTGILALVVSALALLVALRKR
jgi:hypothetical protein